MIAMCFSVVLTSSLATAFAFCPSELGPRARSSTDVITHTVDGKIGDIYHTKHNHLLSALFSSGNDEITDAINRINSEDESEPNEDEDDGDEEDVIFQKLRRNSQRGPINPIQEHDKMMKENHDEATFNATDSDTNGSSASSNTEESLIGSSFYRSLLSSYIDPDANVHDSHSEEYVDDQMYELLSREGKELEKFGPGITTAPLDPSSDEAMVEADLAQKESALQKVVKQIGTTEGRWDKDKIEEAQKLKAEIDRMHIDDCGAVLLANLAFYEAFSARDSDWMKDVWWNSPSVVCVHPSHDPLVGAKAVLGSFKNMFSQETLGRKSRGDGTKPAQNVFMSPANIRALSVRGTTASLVCDEEIFDKNPNEYTGRIIVNKLLTTNVFRKIGGKWKLIHRHASWHPETLAADAGLKAKPGFVPVKSEREKFNDKLTKNRTFSANLEDKRMKITRLAGKGTSIRPADNQPAPTSLDGLNANNVVGIPDEKVKQKKKKKSSEQDDLFRMLGLTSSSEDDGEDDDGDEESSFSTSKRFSLSDLLSNNKGKTTTTGSGTPEDPFITRRVISIGPEQFNQLASEGETIDGDGDEDDDEENVVIDLREKSEDERRNILSRIFPDQVNSLMKSINEKENGSENVGDEMKSASPEEILPVQANKSKSFEPAPIIHPKQTVQSPTQKCIDVIRKLSDKGQLSSKQKRALMTDIIASSARGETSMVEVAYGLLLSEDSDAGMEDFTDQCRVFASASMDGNSDFSV
eukprot:scaffold16279_cov68-Cyclotella_meneghiniana.AAC.1